MPSSSFPPLPEEGRLSLAVVKCHPIAGCPRDRGGRCRRKLGWHFPVIRSLCPPADIIHEGQASNAGDSSFHLRLTAVRICKYVRGAGKTTLGVGSTAGKCNAAWSFPPRLPIPAIPKARSSGKGRTEVRGHRSTTCVAGRVSEVQLSQRLDSLRVRPVGALDSGKDLRIRSRSWEDDSRSWQHSWQMQRSLVVSTETPNTGNPGGTLLAPILPSAQACPVKL